MEQSSAYLYCAAPNLTAVTDLFESWFPKTAAGMNKTLEQVFRERADAEEPSFLESQDGSEALRLGSSCLGKSRTAVVTPS
jgi:hypothetical protein